MDGVLTVLGSVLHGSLRPGSVLWCHLVNWLRDVADLFTAQHGTSFEQILGHGVLSWLQGATDCCYGET